MASTCPRYFTTMILSCGLLAAATRFASGDPASANLAEAQGEQVELFSAIEAEQVEVKVIPKDSTQATVIVQNKTNRPLSIKMPAAFAGIPVLAQNQGGNNNFGGGGNSSSNQSFGGGFGGGGMGGGFGGGFFDVGPDRVAKIKVGTVCLEHGKDDPNPRVAYSLKPISEFTKDGALAEVCRMLAEGNLDQSTAQAAAWHLSDGLTWQELAAKVKVRHLNGQVKMYFHPNQLQRAASAVQLARHRAEENEPSESPGELLGETDSVSVNK